MWSHDQLPLSMAGGTSSDLIGSCQVLWRRGGHDLVLEQSVYLNDVSTKVITCYIVMHFQNVQITCTSGLSLWKYVNGSIYINWGCVGGWIHSLFKEAAGTVQISQTQANNTHDNSREKLQDLAVTKVFPKESF